MTLNDEVKKAGLKCSCGYELLVSTEYGFVFCQNCKKKINMRDYKSLIKEGLKDSEIPGNFNIKEFLKKQKV